VVQVLGDGHVDREFHRVPPAHDQLERRRRRHRRAAVLAAVLLPSVLPHHEVPLHHRDLLGVLGLPFPLGQRRAAVGTHAVRLGQFVQVLFDGKLDLLARPVPGLRRAGRGRLTLRFPFLARRPEHVLAQRRHLLLQLHNLQLQLLVPVVALQLAISAISSCNRVCSRAFSCSSSSAACFTSAGSLSFSTVLNTSL
jgi:hypothetical protein